MDDAAALIGAPKAKRAGLSTALKVVVTLGVLALLATRADWSALAARLENAWTPGLVAGLLLTLAGLILASERWVRSVAAAGADLSRGTALKIAFATLFLGQVLPSGLGGDAVRGWLTYRAQTDAKATITAMFVDRILALFGNLVLMLGALPWLFALAPLPFAATVALAGFGLVGGVLLALQADRLPLPRFARVRLVNTLAEQVARVRVALLTPAALTSGIAAVGVHAMTCLSVTAFAAALGLSVPMGEALTVVPIAILATAVPVSLNGWGAREGALAAGLALYGVATGEALAVSMMVGLAQIVLALPGGFLWLRLKRENADVPR